MVRICLEGDDVWAFQRRRNFAACVVIHVFGPYLTTFMRFIVDDLTVFGRKDEHIGDLRLCFLKCRESRMALNPEKCAFAIKSSLLLDNVVSADGNAVDSYKVAVIMLASPPTTAKQLLRFFGQVCWHYRMLGYLADVIAPLCRRS